MPSFFAKYFELSSWIRQCHRLISWFWWRIISIFPHVTRFCAVRFTHHVMGRKWLALLQDYFSVASGHQESAAIGSSLQFLAFWWIPPRAYNINGKSNFSQSPTYGIWHRVSICSVSASQCPCAFCTIKIGLAYTCVYKVVDLCKIESIGAILRQECEVVEEK